MKEKSWQIRNAVFPRVILDPFRNLSVMVMVPIWFDPSLKMDDSDLVFVPNVSQADGDTAAEVFEDFEDVKDAAEAKPDEIQVPFTIVKYMLWQNNLLTKH